MDIKDEDYVGNRTDGGYYHPTYYNIPADPSLSSTFNVDIDQPILHCFVDAAHGNDVQKRRSTTGVVFTFMGGPIVYKSKTQSLTAGSSTEAEFIAAHTAAKIAIYLRLVLKQLGFEQKDPTLIHIDNLPALQMINDNTSPTERCRHLDIRYWQIQEWAREPYSYIRCQHICGVLNMSDDLTKPLGYVLHSRHCRRMMGHYQTYNG